MSVRKHCDSASHVYLYVYLSVNFTTASNEICSKSILYCPLRENHATMDVTLLEKVMKKYDRQAADSLALHLLSLTNFFSLFFFTNFK